MLVSRFMLDLQEAHQAKLMGLAIEQVTNSSDFSSGSINFVRALGSLSAHIDPSIPELPDTEWDVPQEVNQYGVPRPNEASASLNVNRQIEGSGMEHQLDIVEVQR